MAARAWGGAAMIAGMVLVLAALAVLVPTNGITGNAVADPTCGALGCTELCDVEAPEPTCSQEGMTCCFTHWESGVCEYPTDCERVREYSLYQTLETYQDTVRERPEPVSANWRRFFLPLLVTIAIVGYFAWRRDDRPD